MADDHADVPAKLAERTDAQAIPADVVADLLQRHERATRAYWAAEGRCMSWFVVGPSNFPVARNEKRFNTAHKRMLEMSQHLAAAKRRLDRIAFPHGQGDAIRSADPDALAKLRANVADREQFHEKMKAANVIMRKHGAESCPQLEALGLKEKTIVSVLKPDYMGRIGFPQFALTGNLAEIKRLKGRIAELERNHARGTVEKEAPNGVRLVENAEAARVQLLFPGKPDEATRSLLKSHGFRWAPSEGAWQRHLNNAGRWAAERVISQLSAVA